LVGLATSADFRELFPACDRAILLEDERGEAETAAMAPSSGLRKIPVGAPDAWDRVLAGVTRK